MDDKTYFKIKDYFRKYRHKPPPQEHHILKYLVINPQYLLDKFK